MLAPPPRTRAAVAAARADEELAVIGRSPRRVTRLYPPALLDRAAQQVVAGDMAVRRAAFLFGVPKSTLHDRSAMAASASIAGRFARVLRCRGGLPRQLLAVREVHLGV